MVLAPEAVVAPVPPDKTAKGVVNDKDVKLLVPASRLVKPDTVPPVMATALLFCMAIDPRLPVPPLTAVATNAVVAICVLIVPGAAVGAVGVPVNIGLFF